MKKQKTEKAPEDENTILENLNVETVETPPTNKAEVTKQTVTHLTNSLL